MHRQISIRELQNKNLQLKIKKFLNIHENKIYTEADSIKRMFIPEDIDFTKSDHAFGL